MRECYRADKAMVVMLWRWSPKVGVLLVDGGVVEVVPVDGVNGGNCHGLPVGGGCESYQS